MTRTVDPVLESLLATILRMGSLAEVILEKAMRAVETRDAELGREVQTDDLEIDRLDVEIDEAVLKALALQAPVAEELRQVVGIKTMATDLERVGDIARNIGKCAMRLADRPSFALPPGLAELSEAARRQLRMALDGFSSRDVDKARAILGGDDRLDELQDRLVLEAIAAIETDPASAPQRIDVILIAENLERVGDHATNIAEDIILVAEAKNVKHAEKLARQRAKEGR